jgi:hypothetical protein
MTTSGSQPIITPQLLPTAPEPLPGLTRMRRRLGDRLALRDDLLARLADTPDPTRPGGTLGDVLDVAGDPTLVQIAGLWARVADGVCAYTELTSGESYLGTVQDWTDLRRVVELVGYRPAQRTAAHGWIRTETAPGSAPLVLAGTQIQAPGTPVHSSQTYEVAADTQLRDEWAQLTVTGVPVPTAPAGHQLRFLTDPGFIASDRVAFVQEGGADTLGDDWADWLAWLLPLIYGFSYVGLTGQLVQGLARVTKRADDLGAQLLTFDRSLDKLLPQVSGVSYGAYRVRAELRVPSRLDMVSYVDSGGTPKSKPAPYPSGEASSPYSQTSVYVEDASEASVGQTLVLYSGSHGQCLVTTIKSITPIDWHVAPGTVRRVAELGLVDQLPNALSGGPLTVLLTDPRQAAQHYELPALAPTDTAARVHPRLATLPDQLAVQTTVSTGTTWELSGCAENSADSAQDQGGRIVTLTVARKGVADRSKGSGAAAGNLVPIQHGTTKSGPLTPVAGTVILSGPVTGDVATDGTVTDSLGITVGGVRFDEVPSLYGRGADEPVYTTRLVADGRLAVTFGNGINGMLPRGDISARWRVGGGLVGELDGVEINTLAGSINGVRKVAGVGPTSGAADQEDPLRMRRAAAARIRALDRVVALPDLADLALTVPGTSHSASWRGAGPAGCPCGGSGLHVAVLRAATGGVRPPISAELVALRGYLDARRDTSVPLCVCAAIASAVTVSCTVAVEPRRDPNVVSAAVSSALLDTSGPLAPLPRDLGMPLDGSDVIEVVQPVVGVRGLSGLILTGGASAPTAGDLSIGRLPALPYELLYVGSTTLAGVSA